MSLAICSIVKAEAPYLAEWINFHLLQGVDRFYLYHNAGKDTDQETLKEIEKAKSYADVSYVAWPGYSTDKWSIQRAAYADCLITASDEWVCCIDCDEFLFSPSSKSLKDILSLYDPKTGAILVHWLLYGSNGHIEASDDLVIERFTKHATYLDPHVKTLIRPQAFASTGKNVHRFNLREGWDTKTAPNVSIKADSPWLEQNAPHKRIGSYFTLAHFHTKSREEYRARCKRGRADCPATRSFEENFPVHDVNEVEDDYLYKTYGESVKELLCQRKK